MDINLDQEVAKVEQEYIAANKQFTALDVGNELKTRGINVRQRQVSQIVRQHFTDGDIYERTGYTRTLIPVNNSQTQAFLYFNIDQDPEEYTATDQQPVPWDPNKPISGTSDKTSDSIDDSVTQDDATDDSPAQTTDNAQTQATQNIASVTGQYVASRRSRVMHSPGCMYASRIKPLNRVSFDANDATAQKYRACMREQ